jgi:serine/threonine-protein kinase RsbW
MTTLTHSFPGKPESAGEARAWAARYLVGCPAADDVTLCLGELAANAVLHSRPAGAAFEVRLSIAAGVWVRCEVRDQGPEFRDPAGAAAAGGLGVTKPGPDDENGYGLWLVRELTGGHMGADGQGLYWFVLPWRDVLVPGPRPDGDGPQVQLGPGQGDLIQCPSCHGPLTQCQHDAASGAEVTL